jgi:hypothetical protein
VDLAPTGTPSSAREIMTGKQITKMVVSNKKWEKIFDKEAKAADFVTKYYNGDDSSVDCRVLLFRLQVHFVSRSSAAPLEASILWRDKSETRPDYRNPTISSAMAKIDASRTPRVDTSNRTEVSWLWQERFPRGKLIMLDGDSGPIEIHVCSRRGRCGNDRETIS